MGLLLVGLLYFVSAWITLALSRGPVGLTAMWPSNALLLAALLRAYPLDRGRYLMAGMIASLAANLLVGTAFPEALGISAANIVEAAVAVSLLSRLNPGPLSFTRLGDVAAFAVAALFAPAISATAAVIATGRLGHGAGPFWLSWFATDVLGMFVIAPPTLIALALWHGDEDVRTVRRPGEIALVLAAVAAVAVAAFAQARFPILFLPIAAISIATMRLGPLGAAASLLVIAIVGSTATALDMGPISRVGGGGTVAVLFFQCYLVATFAASLPLASLLAGQRQLAERLRASDRFHRSIIDRSRSVIYEMDLQGRWTFLSPVWTEFTGLPIAESLGTSSLDLITAENRVDAIAGHAQLLAGTVEEVTNEVLYRHVDGCTRWATVRSVLLRETDGRIIGTSGTITDTTEQVLVRRAAEKSERRYRLLADNSSDMIVRFGRDGLRRYVSPACRAIVGYEPAELIRTRAERDIHPEDYERTRSACEASCDGGNVSCVYRQRRKDGVYIWLEATFRCIPDPAGGDADEFIATARDVSQRRAAEIAAAEMTDRLRESHRLLTMTEMVAHVGHWRLDLAQDSLFWSAETYRLHGRDPDDPPTLAGATEAYHPDDREWVDRLVRDAAASGEPFELSARIVRLDGEIRHVRARGQAEIGAEGQVLGLFGIIQDVTRQAEIEAALREGEARYRLLAENASDIIFRLDGDDRFAYVSPSLKTLTGFVPDEMIGGSPMELVHPEDGPALAAGLRDLRAGALQQLTIAFRTRCADGSWRWLETSARTTGGGGGGTREVIGVSRDISDRKRFEAELMQAREAAEDAATEARQLASTDELTGLASRRMFMARLIGEIASAEAMDTPLSVAILDVDHFKQVNDRFGHATGDAVLQAIAGTAVRTVRGHDLVGRLGGEEFAIVMPGARADAAALIGERLRAAVEASAHDHPRLPPITISLGVASLTEGADASTLLAAADDALYAAKKSGRNRLCLAA